MNGKGWLVLLLLTMLGGWLISCAEDPENKEEGLSGCCSSPKKPSGVSASPDDRQISISWDNVTGADRYNLHWANTPGVTKETGNQIPGVTNPYDHSGITNGKIYYYVVTAVSAYGESPKSKEVWAVPHILLPDLIVSDLQVLSFSTNSISYQYSIKNIGEAVVDLNGPTSVFSDNVAVQAFVSSDVVYNNSGDIAAGGRVLVTSPYLLFPGETLTGNSSPNITINIQTHPFLTLMVDVFEVAEESDESNNTVAVLIPSQ